MRRERIEAKIVWFHGASDEVSGSPRIVADLRADGEIISAKTVAAAMRRLGLRGICPKKWRTTTITGLVTVLSWLLVEGSTPSEGASPEARSTVAAKSITAATHSPIVVGGVDTHKDLHVAAIVDSSDRVLGVEFFSTTRAGYRAMLAWMRTFGDLRRVGFECTGSNRST